MVVMVYGGEFGRCPCSAWVQTAAGRGLACPSSKQCNAKPTGTGTRAVGMGQARDGDAARTGSHPHVCKVVVRPVSFCCLDVVVDAGRC
jgi:hypothetical protein